MTEQKFSVENITDEVLAGYMGGKGLGTYLLNREVDPRTDPLGPENSLIFTTGIVSGTRLPGSSRYGVFAKSPLTGFYAESYAGGKVAPAMKSTGFDAIVLQGQSKTPVYLVITPRGVQFKEAGHLWGRDTYRAEDGMLAEVGVKGAQAVVIGPAGEKLVRFACLENNYWRSAGRTGLGAVMGSKKVKGIVFYGDRRVEAARPAKLQEYIRDLIKRSRDNAVVKSYQKLGTPMMVALMNTAGVFPTRYWSQNYYEHWEKISGEYLLEHFKVKPRACPNCVLACGKMTTVTGGPHAGLTVEGPEYETIYAFGGLCCIDKLDAIVYFNDLCDRYGIDTITTGNLCAFAIEAAKQGKLDLDIDYGDAEGVAQLIKDIAERSGVGDLLAEGIKTASIEWDMEDAAVHVKGMEPAGYDPRIFKGMGLAYATSPRGACHLRATFYKPEASGIIDPAATEGKAKLFVEYEDRLTLYDTMIECKFFRDLVLWDDLAAIHSSITGIDFTADQLRQIARRVVDQTRLFNIKAGLTRQDDTLPERLFKVKVGNPAQNITREELDKMVAEYYALRGWDEEGVPGNR